MDASAQADSKSTSISTILHKSIHTRRNLIAVSGEHSPPPQFMISTVATRRSGNDKSIDRAATSVSIKSIKTDGGHSLLKSAVKRIGLRGDQGLPRGRKESRMIRDGVTPSPDKGSASPVLAKSGHDPKISDNLQDASSSSLLDKPLPNLPPNHVNLSGVDQSSSSVVAQTDEPSPSFASESSMSEEWAVTEPHEALTPNTLQKLTRQTGKKLTRQSASRENYCQLGDATHRSQDTSQPRRVSRNSSAEQSPLHQISPRGCRHLLNTNSALHVVNGPSDPFGDDAEITEPIVNKTPEASVKINKAAAAATEKSAKEPTMIAHPRPTKTSSLRARLTAGQLVTDSHTKVVGFTDFTVPSTAFSHRDSYRARKQAQNGRSNDSPRPLVRTKTSAPSLRRRYSAQTLHSNKSIELVAKGHGLALFADNSRLPDVTLRNSRNIQDAPSSSVPGSSSSCKSHVPLPSLERRNHSPYPIIEGQVKPHISSIPLPKNITLSVASKGSDNKPAGLSTTQANTLNRMSHHRSDIFEDQSSSDLPLDRDAKTKGMSSDRGSVQTFSGAIEPRVLTAIEESPQRPSKTNRDTINSPQFGPRLRISPSAERLIMGTLDADVANKENRPVHKSATKTFLQKATTGAYRQPTTSPPPAPDMSFKERSGRPFSSHGLLQSSPRHESFHPSARDKKAKSADLSSTLSMKRISSLDPDTANKHALKAPKESSSNESYFDAQEKLRNSSYDEHLISEGLESSKHLVIDEAAWIAPVKEKTIGAGVEKMKGVKVQHEKTSPRNVLKNLNLTTPNSSQVSTNAQSHVPTKQVSTLAHSSRRVSSSTGNYPPRRSSRFTHPSAATEIPSASPSRREKTPATPPKDKHYQRSIRNYNPVSPNTQQSLIFQPSVRRDSHQSGSSHSTSRKPFSHIRNLFNKRTAAPEASNPKFNELHLSKKSSTSQKRMTNVRKTSAASSGPPSPHADSPFRTHNPRFTSTNKVITSRNVTPSSFAGISTFTTPPLSSGSATTDLAMSLLTAARNEQSSPRKEKLLQMSKIMVDAIMQARDAEKAAEEAKLAARKAEAAKEMCEGLVSEVGRLMEEWKDDLMGAGEMI